MVTKHIDCEEFVSVCCGAESHEYAEDFCGQCKESTNFECIDCGALLADLTIINVKVKSGDYSVGKGFEWL